MAGDRQHPQGSKQRAAAAHKAHDESRTKAGGDLGAMEHQNHAGGKGGFVPVQSATLEHVPAGTHLGPLWPHGPSHPRGTANVGVERPGLVGAREAQAAATATHTREIQCDGRPRTPAGSHWGGTVEAHSSKHASVEQPAGGIHYQIRHTMGNRTTEQHRESYTKHNRGEQRTHHSE